MKKLIVSGVQIAYDLKYISLITLIMVIAVGIPFYNVLESVGGQMFSNSSIPFDVKQDMFSYIETILLVRFSLTIILITSWSFFPRLFYSCKITGEIESTLAIGYSSRQIWFSKGIATLLMSLITSIPFVIFVDIVYRVYIYVTLGMMISFHSTSFLIALILNPLLVFGVVMLAGGFQLLTDDVKKSSFAVIILAIVNVGTIYATKNASFDSLISTFFIVYLLTISLLTAVIYWLNKKMTCENVILSKL